MTAGEEIKTSEVESQLEKEVVVTGKGITAATAPVSNKPEPTKLSYRLQTWEKLENMDQVLFPRPCNYRIPRFKGENEAVEKLAELDAFKAAKVVKVNLDKAHERVRFEVMQSRKSLIAGTPGLKEAVFLLLHPPVEANKPANRNAASRMGIRHFGSALDFTSGIKADLVVLGSVAVDKKGHRIGKGEGFTDLEYALLSKLGVIEPDAVIVTVVHDLQVYEEFPESMFKPWDVPVDVIVTPTQVITVEKKLPRPTLTWKYLSNRRVNDIPIIKQLLEKEQLSGTKIELKEVDSETEEVPHYWAPLRARRKRFVRQRRLTSAPPEGAPRGAMNRGSSAPPPRAGARTFSRRDRRQTLPPNGISADRMKMDGKGGMGMGRRRLGPPMRRIRKPRYTVDFSIRVDGLTTGVRIRELKAALFERNVRPVDISWRAAKGVAFLHFAKRRANQKNGINPASMDEVVTMLQGLAIKSGDGNPTPELKVEGVKPIPRVSGSSVTVENGTTSPTPNGPSKDTEPTSDTTTTTLLSTDVKTNASPDPTSTPPFTNSPPSPPPLPQENGHASPTPSIDTPTPTPAAENPAPAAPVAA